MPLSDLLRLLGDELVDVEEECFLLFSSSRPSRDLGFLDAGATTVDVTVGDDDFTIVQSPTLLRSNRNAGTTGAVVWGVTPRIAEWMVSVANPLFSTGVLHSASRVLELGCGVSGVVALSLFRKVGRFIASDQDYVMKLLRENIHANGAMTRAQVDGPRRPSGRARRSSPRLPETRKTACVDILTLDWEQDQISSDLLSANAEPAIPQDLDLVIACDCVYNETLIEPFNQACVDACRLRGRDEGSAPTICLVAQQLRSPEVFELWLTAFHASFRSWRLPDGMLVDSLKSGSGFVVHAGILRDESPP